MNTRTAALIIFLLLWLVSGIGMVSAQSCCDLDGDFVTGQHELDQVLFNFNGGPAGDCTEDGLTNQDDLDIVHARLRSSMRAN